MRIAYLGPVNSYSFVAADTISKGDELCEYAHLTDAIRSVGRETDCAVVPYENSTEGTVCEVLDCLIHDVDLYITREIVLPIENYLLLREGAAIEDIRRVYTHPQPYAQCRGSISRLLGGAEVIFTPSTSAAAAMADGVSAAIGGRRLAANGIVAHSAVNDSEGNCTRFILLSKNAQKSPENSKFSLIFEAKNEAGGLLRVLEIFARYGLNLSKLESRPHKKILGRYIFVADVEANPLHPNCAAALTDLQPYTIKFLGSYPSSTLKA